MFSIPSTPNRNLCSRPSVARHFESRLLLPYASCMPGLALASFGHTGCGGSQMSDELNNAISSTPLTCTRMAAASPFWASSCRVTPERCAGHEVQQGDVRTDPNAAGNHRKSMMQAVEASLKRLKTDYIDLYWVHVGIRSPQSTKSCAGWMIVFVARCCTSASQMHAPTQCRSQWQTGSSPGCN